MSQYSYSLFTLFYFLVSLCFVFRTSEFISAGLTIEYIFEKYLGSEHENFILYNIKKTSLTLFTHSLLPVGYVVGLTCLSDSGSAFDWSSDSVLWNVVVTISVLLPFIVSITVCYWSRNNFENHPVAKKLKVFCNDSQTSWRSLASSINVEFRRVEKITLRCSSVATVHVTENWIIKLTPYQMYVANQGCCVLILSNADTHLLSSAGVGTVQYLTIDVKATEQDAQSFFIRCNALDFKDLEDRVQRPIIVLQDVTFHRSRLDQFIDVFRQQVELNPRYIPVQGIEQCIGCMIAQSSVKLVKCCGDNTSTSQSCVNCYCRPMWCLDCMAKWFALRQEQDHPETWLSSKCTCPVCRATFCVLDVCLLDNISP